MAEEMVVDGGGANAAAGEAAEQSQETIRRAKEKEGATQDTEMFNGLDLIFDQQRVLSVQLCTATQRALPFEVSFCGFGIQVHTFSTEPSLAVVAAYPESPLPRRQQISHFAALE